jgi:hypothetical protein
MDREFLNGVRFQKVTFTLRELEQLQEEAAQQRLRDVQRLRYEEEDEWEEDEW